MRYFRSTYCKQLTANKADANTYVSVKSTVTIITGRKEVVAKVMFLHVSVILFTGGGLQAGRTPPTGRNPPGRENPPDQTDPRDQGEPPPRAGRTPPDQADPPREADSRIRSTSGRYTSYWNAFLLVFLCVLLYQR